MEGHHRATPKPVPGEFSAVTITHNPSLHDGRLARQIGAVARVADLHVIVDNASANFGRTRELVESFQAGSRHLIIQLQKNVGVASALNIGVRNCLEKSSANWVLLLDQDTCFSDETFVRAADEVTTIGDNLRPGVIGFNSLRRRTALVSMSNSSGHVTPKHSVMTTGSFVSRDVLQRFPFDESLFMYFVDVDFCRRVERSGWTILQLFHSVIDVQEGQVVNKWGRTWSVLEPWRIYYVARNGIRVFHRYGSLSDLLYVLLVLSGNLLARESWARTSIEFSRGLIDGLRG